MRRNASILLASTAIALGATGAAEVDLVGPRRAA
jgi:hypothetical protein